MPAFITGLSDNWSHQSNSPSTSLSSALLHLSVPVMFPLCNWSFSSVFSPGCDSSLRLLSCFPWHSSVKMFGWVLLTHVGGVGMADVVQIGAMWTEHLQMAQHWCQLFYWFEKNPSISIKWWFFLKTLVVNKICLHVSFCKFSYNL